MSDSDKETETRKRDANDADDDSDSSDEEKEVRKRAASDGDEDSDSDGDKRKAIRKRDASDSGDDDDGDDEGWVGPRPEEAAHVRKKRVLEYEAVYLDRLPMGENYERSFMHRDTVTHVVVTATDFVITASQDGHIKFWKKQEVSVEFVKHFRAHLGNIADVSVNSTGTLLATVSSDKACKVFDIVNFDMINMLKLNYVPTCAQWIHRAGDALQELAIGETATTNINIYDGRGSSTPLAVLSKVHMKPVTVMIYCPVYDIVVSADEGGMLEYWSGSRTEYSFPRNVAFQSKVETDLYEFAKNKTVPLNMSVSPNGRILAVFSADRKIRMFKLLTGKLFTVIDESLQHYTDLQQVKQLLPPMEFGKKLSVEKEVSRSGVLKYNSLVFDESGNFLLYSSFLGVKLVNLTTQRVARVFGQREHLRPLALALFQGRPKSLSGTALTTEMEASDNPGLVDHGTDPTLIVTAYKKNRFYLFTNRSAKDLSSVDNDRDVFNEKPSKEDIISATEEKGAPRLYESATVHTTIGDMHFDLFPRECPKTVENFCVHARNGYYNGHIFHRVIKQFMIQTGDPDGIGTGGESIWGGEFEDEFSPKLRHDRPYTVSMANAGANTNGSQFFITVCPTPWLDNKHTVFARVVRGMEIAQNISNVKTHPKTDKPYDDINIVSISVRNPVSL